MDSQKKSKVVICLTTHNRIDCARINMEIIKLNYELKWPIVHACSNSQYSKYIEDALVECSPKPTQAGALNLLLQSIEKANEMFAPDYIIHLEADTWLMNQATMIKYIEALERNPKSLIAGSCWDFDKSIKWQESSKLISKLKFQLSRLSKKLGLKWHIGWKNTIATQFFIAKNTNEFRQALSNMPEPKENQYLEKLIYANLIKKFGKKCFIEMLEREPVHPNNRDSCEAMELYCQHFPTQVETSSMIGKKQVLEKYPSLIKGGYMSKLMHATNFEYYNPGANRH